MKIMRCLQVCFIYIGAIIGAGFATGREIMLYFGGSGMFSRHTYGRAVRSVFVGGKEF